MSTNVLMHFHLYFGTDEVYGLNWTINVYV